MKKIILFLIMMVGVYSPTSYGLFEVEYQNQGDLITENGGNIINSFKVSEKCGKSSLFSLLGFNIGKNEICGEVQNICSSFFYPMITTSINVNFGSGNIITIHYPINGGFSPQNQLNLMGKDIILILDGITYNINDIGVYEYLEYPMEGRDISFQSESFSDILNFSFTSGTILVDGVHYIDISPICGVAQVPLNSCPIFYNGIYELFGNGNSQTYNSPSIQIPENEFELNFISMGPPYKIYLANKGDILLENFTNVDMNSFILFKLNNVNYSSSNNMIVNFSADIPPYNLSSIPPMSHISSILITQIPNDVELINYQMTNLGNGRYNYKYSINQNLLFGDTTNEVFMRSEQNIPVGETYSTEFSLTKCDT